MSNTFDRYLLSRLLYLFIGFFATSMGLFAVVDGFLNLDGFQKATEEQGAWSMVWFMGHHYVLQSAWIFDLIGPTLLSISVVTLLALMIRQGEVNPLLAAGVPTYRLVVPLLMGTALVHAVLVANKELLLPRIAAHLTGTHGDSANDGRRVEPQFDRLNRIYISGRELVPGGSGDPGRRVPAFGADARSRVHSPASGNGDLLLGGRSRTGRVVAEGRGSDIRRARSD